MKPIEFVGADTIYEKPQSMTDEQCLPLPVKQTMYEGFPALVSCWQLTPEEIADTNKTGCIYLTVVSNVHPPVMLSTK